MLQYWNRFETNSKMNLNFYLDNKHFDTITDDERQNPGVNFTHIFKSVFCSISFLPNKYKTYYKYKKLQIPLLYEKAARKMLTKDKIRVET